MALSLYRRVQSTLRQPLLLRLSHSSSFFTEPLHHHHHQEEEGEEPLQGDQWLSSPEKPTLPPFKPCPEADLISQLLLTHHNPYHPMESALQLHGGITITHSLLHQILLRLRHASKVSLAFFHFARSHSPDFSPDPASYNILIDTLSRVRQFDVAWQLIVSQPNLTAFCILIRRLVSAGLTHQAVRAFDDIAAFVEVHDKDNLHSSCFRYLLDTLCKYGYVKLATALFNRRKSDVDVDEKVYTILIYGWCKVKKVEMARRFLTEMMERGIEPNVVTYNVLLNGICRRRSLHPDERFEKVVREAEELLDEMRGRGIEPDVTSYSIVIHVYSRAHMPELTLAKFRVMREKGIFPSVATYTSVVKCLCSCGRIEDAEVLIEQMVCNGVNPTAETYNSFFKEYRGRKDVDGAMRLYRKMKDDNMCSPSIHTYNILLGMLVKLSKMGLAREIWDDMKGSLVGPDLDSYTLMVHGMCEKKRWLAACEFFMEMIEKGYLPQKVTFETLYKGLIQSDMLRTWRRLKKKLEEESITFGSEFEDYHLKPYRR